MAGAAGRPVASGRPQKGRVTSSESRPFFHGDCGDRDTRVMGPVWPPGKTGAISPVSNWHCGCDWHVCQEEDMAIATAPVDFDAYDRTPKPTPLDGPALEALKACAELRSASLDALRSLSRQATLRPVGRGATVAAQGTRLDAAILVVRGRIRSVCRAPNGREISVEVFRSGDLIADFVLAGDLPLANDWEAVESSSLLLIPREAFMTFLRGAPEVLV